MEQMRLILASGSPRRRELLAQAGFSFEVVTSDADETGDESLGAEGAAKRNALAKAAAVAEKAGADALVVGADTVVTLDGALYGKPESVAHARLMLGELSGRTHQVITGVALVSGDAFYSFAESTDVTFKELNAQQIDAYIATGDPMDKAGAYGIQSESCDLVDHIEGDYDNVVGLPVTRLARMLQKLGVEPEARRP